MRKLSLGMALLSLLFCLAVAVLHFRGSLSQESYRTALLLASAAWFIFSYAWSARKS